MPRVDQERSDFRKGLFATFCHECLVQLQVIWRQGCSNSVDLAKLCTAADTSPDFAFGPSLDSQL